MKRLLLVVAIGTLGAACRGAIDNEGSSPRGSGGVDQDLPPAAELPDIPLPDGPPPAARLHKLTAIEVANSVRDLLGAEVHPSDLEPDQESDGSRAVAASLVSVSALGVDRYESILGAAIEHALGDATRAAKLVPCVPPLTANPRPCLTQDITRFGLRAFRRPLSAAETERYVALAEAIAKDVGGTSLIGLQQAFAAMLQSPSFLYRVELGEPSAADGGRLKYTSYEMASRLASVLWRTVPDPLLMNRAGKNDLATGEGVRQEAARMLRDARGRDGLRDFVEDLSGLHHLRSDSKDTTMFPAWTPALMGAMREDLLSRFRDVVFDDPRDLLEIYDGRMTFVNNELAALYGLPTVAPDGFRRAELPEDSPRRGILGSGAVLATYSHAQRSSPTLRGKFVAERLLCKTVPVPPPEGVNAAASFDMAGHKDEPLRARLEQHRANPACAGCHGLTDPIGVGLESFDALGAFRTSDGGRAIDASGDLDGAPFANAAELAARLRQHPRSGACFVRKLYAHAQARTAVEADGSALKALARLFVRGGNRVDQLLLDLVSSEAFRFITPSAP